MKDAHFAQLQATPAGSVRPRNCHHSHFSASRRQIDTARRNAFRRLPGSSQVGFYSELSRRVSSERNATLKRFRPDPGSIEANWAIRISNGSGLCPPFAFLRNEWVTGACRRVVSLPWRHSHHESEPNPSWVAAATRARPDCTGACIPCCSAARGARARNLARISSIRCRLTPRSE